jgi:hypothetical protein
MGNTFHVINSYVVSVSSAPVNRGNGMPYKTSIQAAARPIHSLAVVQAFSHRLSTAATQI